MKSNYIADLKPGADLQNEPFLLYDLARRTMKDGRPFILATLRDKTGLLSGVFWDLPPYIDMWLRPGLLVLVSGKLGIHKDSLQVTITDLNQSGPLDMSDFLPASRRPQAEMIAELRDVIGTLAEPWRGLVGALLLEDPLASRYANAPAARQMHHAYIGGLMEHSLSMAAIAMMLTEHYRYVNYNLLVSGALLHDLGKIEEYSLEDGFGHSDDGRLVGHITRGVVMVERAAASRDFPADDLRHLVHLIASHHGTNEWGSPVIPRTLEGVLLHQIDLLDSRVQGFYDHVGNDTNGGDWTTKRSEMFGTELLRPPGFGE